MAVMDHPAGQAGDAPTPNGQPAGRPPRVVMLLANQFTHDTRVFKEARSLIEWGCEVHIVAMAAIRTKMRYSNVPPGLRGLGITMIITGLMAIGFMCFVGISF